jgi:hypothetical protein
MTVKVDAETMTLKVMDCDPFEGHVLSTTHDKTIDVVLVDSTTPEEYVADLTQAEETQRKTSVLEQVIEITIPEGEK